MRTGRQDPAGPVEAPVPHGSHAPRRQGQGAGHHDPEVRQRLDEQNLTVESGSVQKFGDFIALQTRTWTRIIKDNKIEGLD